MLRRSTALAVLFALSACNGARSPSKVCERIATLVKSKDVAGLSHDACVEQLEEMRKTDAKGYECTVDCVLAANDGAAAEKCIATCGTH